MSASAPVGRDGSEGGGTLCLPGMEEQELRWKRVLGLSQVEVWGERRLSPHRAWGRGKEGLELGLAPHESHWQFWQPAACGGLGPHGWVPPPQKRNASALQCMF